MKSRLQYYIIYGVCFLVTEAFSPYDKLQARFSSSLFSAASTDNGTKRTLYDALGGSPTETRAELKKRYLALAKLSHPDAIGHEVVDSEDGKDQVNFYEISAAWSILSDTKERRRYDRSLQAEQFTRNVESWAGDVASTFFKKKPTSEKNTASKKESTAFPGKATSSQGEKSVSDSKTAYAVTGLHKDTEKLQNQEGNESSKQVSETSQNGAQSLEEQAKKLEKQAAQKEKKAKWAREELQQLVERRLTVALHTQGSGLTAAEANVLYERFNKTVGDHVSPLDRALLRHTCHQEITTLQENESCFIEVQKEDAEVQEMYAACVGRRMDSIEKLKLVKEAENDARRRWKEAKEKTTLAKRELADLSRALVQAKLEANKIDAKLERKTSALARQSEIVRNALKRKERLVFQKSGVGKAVPDETSRERLAELEELQKRESSLSKTAKLLDNIAANLLLEAHEIKSQAEKKEEQNW